MWLNVIERVRIQASLAASDAKNDFNTTELKMLMMTCAVARAKRRRIVLP